MTEYNEERQSGTLTQPLPENEQNKALQIFQHGYTDLKLIKESIRFGWPGILCFVLQSNIGLATMAIRISRRHRYDARRMICQAAARVKFPKCHTPKL